MWFPKIYKANEDKIINLQVCKIHEGIKVYYFIQGIGEQPTNTKLRMWISCPISKKDFKAFMTGSDKSLRALAHKLYDLYLVRRKILEAEMKEVEIENHLEQIYSMFEE